MFTGTLVPAGHEDFSGFYFEEVMSEQSKEERSKDKQSKEHQSKDDQSNGASLIPEDTQGSPVIH